MNPISRKKSFAALILCLWVWCLGPGPVFAASVQATVDRKAVSLGESLQFQVKARGVREGKVDISPIRDFKVISRGTSSRLRVVNGEASREILFNYTLIPLKTGDLEIPSLAVRTTDGTHRTQGIPISVSRRSEGDAEERDIFVTAEVSKEAPYTGEQIIYTFRLHRTLRIADAHFQRPDFAGFTAEQIGEEEADITIIDGRRYHTTTLSYILIPMAPGPETIGPAILECRVVQRDQRRGNRSFDFDSLFGSPFFNNGRFETRVLQTRPVDIEVRQLPGYQGTDPFSGLVGQMDIRASLEKRELAAGESTTLTLVIEGAGNIMDAQAPAIDLPEGIKVYEDAPQEEIALDRDGYVGKKTFRMALVPLEPGDYPLPPASVTFFDPRSETYETRRTTAFSLSVRQGEAESELTVVSPPGAGDGPEKEKVAFTGRDILPLKDDLEALEDRAPLSIRWFLVLLFVPAALFAVVGGVSLLTRRGEDPASIMARRARTSLKSASAGGIGSDAFLSCLYRALVSAIFARAGTQGESLTRSEAEALLRDQGLPEAVGQQASALLEEIESVRFGGGALERTHRNRLLSETRKMVRRMA